jgi:hypothetical protein
LLRIRNRVKIVTIVFGHHAKLFLKKYYKQHKKEMLAGVKLLWAEKEEDHYYNLMLPELEVATIEQKMEFV